MSASVTESRIELRMLDKRIVRLASYIHKFSFLTTVVSLTLEWIIPSVSVFFSRNV